MEYRTLENTDSVCIYEAFTQAFSDYQVSVDMPFKSFETMLKRNGFMPAVSVGAFADRTLVGFILNGVRDWDNEKTVYDLGTGVIPDFRRTGIMGELLNLVRTICIKNKISVYQLEVIQDNEKALTLYKKQGFRINRILNCYQLTGKIKEPGVYKVWKLEHPEKLQDDQWTAVKDFWSYPPSWQNAKDAVCAIAKSFSYTIVKFDGNLIGYGIVDKMKGDGVDICISSKQAPFLIADIILSQLRRYTEYNHFNNPENAEAASFQAGDIFIDPPRRMVKVRGQSVNLRPREFSLLLYFMRNINIVLTSEQICEHAWGMEGSYKRGVSGPIAILRKIIETDPTCPRYIETVSRIGYRFTAYHSEICDNYSDDEVAL